MIWSKKNMYILFEDAMHGEIGSNPSEILGLCLMKWPGQNGSKCAIYFILKNDIAYLSISS